VDKYLTLAVLSVPGGFSAERAARVRQRLFSEPSYLHPPDTEEGERYRFANGLAARFARALEERYLLQGRLGEVLSLLRRFHRVGQSEKLALAAA
jgi:hypothetical protein